MRMGTGLRSSSGSGSNGYRRREGHGRVHLDRAAKIRPGLDLQVPAEAGEGLAALPVPPVNVEAVDSCGNVELKFDVELEQSLLWELCSDPRRAGTKDKSA